MNYSKRPQNREKGVLLPVFSLPSKYGIGCFSKEARDLIDWLGETGHAYWQILPLNPTGVADSPYQPLSSFAGNAYFIDPEQLAEQGLISEEELAGYDFGENPARVDYDALYETRMEMLRVAYSRFARQQAAGAAATSGGATATGTPQKATSGGAVATGVPQAAPPTPYRRFLDANAFWLEDYALFMSLRDEYGKELSWDEWPTELRRREDAAMGAARERHAEDIGFYRWTQYEFYRQWSALKEYANRTGVQIIGDMPVYVSYDSSDCWAAPEQFQLDEDLRPTLIAGVPPDDFAVEGQLWGNPLYDWEKMKANGYHWWISRILQSFVMYDVIRLDHFRGYEAYYSCEADAPNAMNGFWRPGPGLDLFQRLEQGPDQFIAEDLGFLTEGVRQLLQETGFPGTKVLQFAFDNDPGNMYLPENYGENCAVYTGTHDNDTTVGWYRKLSQDERAGILQYLGYTVEEAWWLVLEADAATLRGEALAEPVYQAVNAVYGGEAPVEAKRQSMNEVYGGEAPAEAKRQAMNEVYGGEAPAEAGAKADRVAPRSSSGDATPAGQRVENAGPAADVYDQTSAEPAPDSKEAGSVPVRLHAICAANQNGQIPDPAIIATDGLIEKAMNSSAKIVIIPLQDYLHLGTEARVNVPGTIVDNWCWRTTALQQLCRDTD